MTAATPCRTCHHIVGWKRGAVEGWICSRGYVFAAIYDGVQLPSRTELRRADLKDGAECGEWEARR